jgi:magnesium chelatase subunit D
MTENAPSLAEPNAEAMTALLLLSCDPEGLGGAVLRGNAGPHRDAWVNRFQRTLPRSAIWQRVPAHIGRDRLTGALDVAATLAAGRPVHDPGLLKTARGKVLVLASAERLAIEASALIANAIDDAAGFSVLAFDESVEDDERVPPILAERLAFLIPVDLGAPLDLNHIPETDDARRRLHKVVITQNYISALAHLACLLGI